MHLSKQYCSSGFQLHLGPHPTNSELFKVSLPSDANASRKYGLKNRTTPEDYIGPPPALRMQWSYTHDHSRVSEIWPDKSTSLGWIGADIEECLTQIIIQQIMPASEEVGFKTAARDSVNKLKGLMHQIAKLGDNPIKLSAIYGRHITLLRTTGTGTGTESLIPIDEISEMFLGDETFQGNPSGYLKDFAENMEQAARSLNTLI